MDGRRLRTRRAFRTLGTLGTFRTFRTFGALLTVAAVSGGCAMSATSASTSTGRVAVVAAEDFWGSIARQLGGDHVTVHSLIANPNTDPHDYEPTPADARAVASSTVVIIN